MDKKGLKKIGNVVGKIISYISLLILFLVAIFLLFYIITNNIAKTKGDYPPISLFTIVSQSMEPNINVYDVIIDTKVNKETDLKVGDIITFFSETIDTGGYTVTHRIKEIVTNGENTYFITKGDNNLTSDVGVTTFDKIVGKVQFIIPQLGRIQFFISSRLGWLLIILIPAIGIILIDIFKMTKLLRIKNQIESIPKIKEVEVIREKEDDKVVRALIEKANRINKNRK